jgi:hypothetical protein
MTTPSTLGDELQRIADRAPVAAVPDDTWMRARRARRRDRALTVAATAAVVALLAGLVAWLPSDLDPPVADTDGLGVPDHLYAVPERMSDRENDGSWMRDEVADDPTVVGVGAAAWVTYQGLPVVVGAADGRYHLLDLPDFAGNNWNFAVGQGNPVVALSPSGRELAYGYAVFGPDAATRPIPSGVRVVDLGTGERREIPVPGNEGTMVRRIEWSPDGSWLAFTGMQPDHWTAESSGSDGIGGPVLGRIAPGAATAVVRPLTNDEVGLTVDDQGTVTWFNGGLREWGEGGTNPVADVEDPFLEGALGSTADGGDLRLNRGEFLPVGPAALVGPEGPAHPVIDLPDEIAPSLSVATQLMTTDRPTVGRPEPDWPWSEEHGVYTVVGVLALAALLGAVLLGRRYRVAR